MKNNFGFFLLIFLINISLSAQSKEQSFTIKQAYNIGKELYFDESNDQNDIEKDLDTCLKKLGGWQCWAEASENYEKVLQVLFKGIVNNTSNKSEIHDRFVKSVVESQERWEEFSKAETKANQQYTLTDEMGTIMSVVIAHKKLKLIKARIISLMVFYGIGQS